MPKQLTSAGYKSLSHLKIYLRLPRSPYSINILSLVALPSLHNTRIQTTMYFPFGAHLASREHPLTPNWLAWVQKSKARSQPLIQAIQLQAPVSTRFFTKFCCPEQGTCAHWRNNMAAGIPFMEETGRKDVQNGGRSILKNDHGFWTLLVTFGGKIYFFLLFTSNLSYFNSL